MPSRNALSVSASWLIYCVVGVVLFSAVWSYVFTAWPASESRLSDLYPRWYGSRELLLRGRNPYSEEVTREIQEWQRGRPARAGEDEGRFAYPVYVAFVLSPTIGFEFSTVNKVMFWLLILCAAASAFLFLKFVDWRVSPGAAILVLLYSLGSFAVAFGARLEQLAPAIILLIGASLLSVVANRLVTAGVLLAFATIKPQLTILLVPWLLGWSLGDWSHRKRLFWSFFVTMAVLVVGSELLVHRWLVQFIRSAVAYTNYTDGRSLLTILAPWGSTVVSILFVGSLSFLCWRFHRSPADTNNFIFCSSVVLAATLVIIPTIAPHGQLLLLPGIFLLVRYRKTIWDGGRRYRHLLLSVSTILAWPSIFALGLCIGALLYGTQFIQRFWLLPVGGTLLLPLAVTIALVAAKRRMLSCRTDTLT